MNSVALEEELLGTKMDVQFACNNFEILCPTPQCTKITARTDSGQSSEVQLHAVLDLTIRETTERFVVAATMPMGYLVLVLYCFELSLILSLALSSAVVQRRMLERWRCLVLDRSHAQTEDGVLAKLKSTSYTK